jgi:kynureninase
LARQSERAPVEAAIDDAFAAIDAMNERRAHSQSLNDQAVAIADAEVGPRILKVTLPCDPQGFVAKARHNSAWTAVWRREMRRMVQCDRAGVRELGL